MALTLGDNFSYGGSKPLDARLNYSTLSTMKAVADSTMYDGCIAYCVETDKTYQWKSTNTVDPNTGKWEEFSSGGGGGSEITVDSALSSTSENPVQNKVINNNLTYKYDLSDTLYTSIADNEYMPFRGAANTSKKGRISWSNIKDALKSYFDTLYSTVRSRGTPTSGGTALSLVNTGDMYTWNGKQNALTAGTNIGISGNVISTTSTYMYRYLQTEQQIGTSPDGSPVYSKLFVLNNVLTNASAFTTYSFNHSISNIGRIVNIDSSWNVVNNGAFSGGTIPYSDDTYVCNISSVNSTQISLKYKGDWRNTVIYINLIYTK